MNLSIRKHRDSGNTAATVEEVVSGIIVRCNTLQQSESVAHPIGSGCRQLGGVEQRIYRYDFL